MLDCKCLKNLVGFAASRPPFVIFTLCLAVFAAGLFSVGYYVHSYGKEDTAISQWEALMKHISNKEYCMFDKNMTQVINNTNGTTESTVSSLNMVHVNLPVILRFSPNSLYFGTVKNISHITTLVQGSELGLGGEMSSELVNLTFSLGWPWSESCSNKKCKDSEINTCVSVLLPEGMISSNIPNGYCNATLLVRHMVLMVVSNHCGKYCCKEGITAKASFPSYLQPHSLEGPSEMGLDDWATVNLRLQYSSYFLFVMAITCIVYGMIKGRPTKSMSKKGNCQTM